MKIGRKAVMRERSRWVWLVLEEGMLVFFGFGLICFVGCLVGWLGVDLRYVGFGWWWRGQYVSCF
jgi:hypothetical protein